MSTPQLVDRPLVKKIHTEQGHYAYDARTNRLLRITPAMYDALDYVGGVSEPEICTALADRHQATDIAHALKILKEVIDTHHLLGGGPLERRAGPLCADAATARLRNGADLMTLEMTDACNLRCKYCIFSGDYPHSRAHGQHKMSFAVAKAAVDFYRPLRKEADSLSIGFYGGEPLLNFEVIKQCCEYVRECERGEGYERPIHFALTTNATLLTDDKIAFFIQQGLALTASVDGPQEIHDECRVFANGKGTFETVLRNLQRVYDANSKYYNDKVLINCTLSPASNLMAMRDFFDAYPHLFGGKLNISAVSKGNESFTDSHPAYLSREEDLSQLGQEFYAAHANGHTSSDEFRNSFVRQLFERIFLLFHRRDIRSTSSDALDRISACFPGARKIFVDVDGQLHMCERVYRQFPIGDVWNGYDIQKVTDVFNQFSAFMDSEECRNCWAVQMCPHCFTVGAGGEFPIQLKQEPCAAHRRELESVIRHYSAILEENPTAFDYMNDYLIT